MSPSARSAGTTVFFIWIVRRACAPELRPKAFYFLGASTSLQFSQHGADLSWGPRRQGPFKFLPAHRVPANDTESSHTSCPSALKLKGIDTIRAGLVLAKLIVATALSLAAPADKEMAT